MISAIFTQHVLLNAAYPVCENGVSKKGAFGRSVIGYKSGFDSSERTIRSKIDEPSETNTDQEGSPVRTGLRYGVCGPCQ
ncbi:MAG: hypothetical protein FWF53_07110 [Candidatus Azobacteroides sp.]|nr:hypothetical protein [Candidatus Azobacteroides sp.]